MKVKKFGFTLVEMMAVIILLGVVSLIAIPQVNKIIKNTRMSVFEDSAYGVIRSGEIYYKNREILGEPLIDTTFVFPNADGLEINGDVPKSGKMVVTSDGFIKLAISNGKYCARKDYNDSKVSVNEDINNCTLESVGTENPGDSGGSDSGEGTGGNTGSDTPQDTIITNIELNTESVSLINGGSYQIEATISPSDATNKTLSYKSNDESIATVNELGIITGIKAGETVITVSTTDGSNISKVINVIVRQQISNVELNTESVSLINGGSYQIEATIIPSDATNKTLRYTSNDTSIATVSSTGLITGIAGGETIITVSTQDGSNISKSIDVIVRAQIENVTLSETNVEINVGESKTIKATITPTNAYLQTLLWNSEDDSIATVNNGVITGVNVGTTKVTATTQDGSNITKEINVKVVNSLLTSNYSCISNIYEICLEEDIKSDEGILVNVQVNDSENYDFYVIKDTGSELTLIMNQNIGNNVAWYANAQDNSYGPITALNHLNSETAGWINISLVGSYKYDNNLNGTTNTYGYQKLEITNGIGLLTSKNGNTTTELTGINRARLLTYEEAISLGCTTTLGSCPNWLYGNLYADDNTSLPYGHWLLTANPTSLIGAWRVDHHGRMNANYVNDVPNGLHPVIKISKSLLS